MNGPGVRNPLQKGSLTFERARRRTEKEQCSFGRKAAHWEV